MPMPCHKPRLIQNKLWLLLLTPAILGPIARHVAALAQDAPQLNPATPQPYVVVGKQADGSYLMPTGQIMAPVGANLLFPLVPDLHLPNRPVDMALSSDGKTLAVMTNSLVRFLDTQTNQFQPRVLRGTRSFGGIAWSSDGHTLYTAGSAVTGQNAPKGSAALGAVLVTHFDNDGQPQESKPIVFALRSHIEPNTQAKDAKPAGLALAPDNKTLYVSLYNNGTLAVVDLTSYNPQTGAATVHEVPVGSSPECVLVNPTGTKIYVANRGGRAPEAGDTMDREDPVVIDPKTSRVATGTISVIKRLDALLSGERAPSQTIAVGLQPVALCFAPDAKRLYVANANSDSVSVVDTVSDTVVETIPTSPAPGRLAASSSNGLAVAPDGRTLYVTLGGDNAVEVVALDRIAGGTSRQTRIAGLIPTAWFPLAVTLGADGQRLYVANSKGIGSLAAPVNNVQRHAATTPEAGPGGFAGAATALGHSVYATLGSISVIDVPDATMLTTATAQVARHNGFTRMAQALTARPDPFWSRFKHVILIIKENRTYDQVYGDMPVPPGHPGGDPHLVMFGAEVTPNQHALAREFGLFDNLYCSGAISADGHHWLNEAFADDYDERAMDAYPRSYPCCGSDPLSFAGNQFFWQAALAAGISFHDYGEFGPLPSIQPYYDKHWRDPFTVTASRNRDTFHAERIAADIAQFETTGGMPQLSFIWLANNHTSGTKPGAYTPQACVADNDLGVGKVVEAVTHSKRLWQDEPTAIFIVEDDAQGGLDHIDGHRTAGLVISPFTKRGQVFSSHYNQVSMVRTMELMLGMKPLNQFDAAAVPMRDAFQQQANFSPFAVQPNRIALNLKNPPARKLAAQARHWALVSAQLDFSAPDRADPEQLTEVLWHAAHGEAAYPPADAARGG